LLFKVLEAKKVFAETGVRQVGQMTSAERGTTMTFVGIIGAGGARYPPALIFPRVHYKTHFMNGLPSDWLGLAHASGCMTSELFIDLLKHIRTLTNCSMERKLLIVLDNHASHTSIEAILFCRKNGIVLLSFPPHCSHKLQPLDVSVFGPFKINFRAALLEEIALKKGMCFL
jgi:hypothetical protein